MSSMRWYAVQAFSGMEKSVKAGLEERIVRANLQDQFGDILVPVEEVVEMKGGQKTISERRLYPGYVLVQMEMTDQSWHLVKSTPRVTSFIGGSAQRPTPIKDKEVEIILRRMDDSKSNPTQKMTFEKGESVRVIDGPFKDFSGTVEEINYDKNKVRVSVVIFGRATPVELDFAQVEKEI
ncbi:MAG: transcription termination/antitermination protein NusG [Methylophilus sp.]|uniref:transcription termination/antitermination protein NusG n=1 Tax=Methylophilus sp. TaxID=29541 RepID=UPI002B726067|nr:transcription termination/antitermination protein NusG [Methylophilus sp.]HSH86246.1 transcription termination/antitermination protein NusG [Methylophilus sp.]